VATYTTPLLSSPHIGWTPYSFTINAVGGIVPPGWVFTHGDGTPATDAEWAAFLSQIDLRSVGYYGPGTFYPSTGTWTLSIDNISITTAPVSEPGSIALLSLRVLALSVTCSRRR
jgi:hypothetical protein